MYLTEIRCGHLKPLIISSNVFLESPLFNFSKMPEKRYIDKTPLGHTNQVTTLQIGIVGTFAVIPLRCLVGLCIDHEPSLVCMIDVNHCV